MPRLSWRKQPNETGLASVGQGPRGMEMRFGKDLIASVSPVTQGDLWTVVGWYFYTVAHQFGVPSVNTYSKQHWDNIDDAKAACDQYVRKHFKAPSAND